MEISMPLVTLKIFAGSNRLCNVRKIVDELGIDVDSIKNNG